MTNFIKLVKTCYINGVKRGLLWNFSIVCKYSKKPVTATLVYCASQENESKKKIVYPDAHRLSHENLIQQACTGTVNSASQLLTVILIAVVDIGQKYRKALEDQMSLMEESLNNIENSELQDELTDLLTAARSDVDTFKRNFMELMFLMDYVEKLANSTTETSFLAGAETACTALSERLHAAKLMINEQNQLNKKLENEMYLLHQALIRRSGKPNEKKQ